MKDDDLTGEEVCRGVTERLDHRPLSEQPDSFVLKWLTEAPHSFGARGSRFMLKTRSQFSSGVTAGFNNTSVSSHLSIFFYNLLCRDFIIISSSHDTDFYFAIRRQNDALLWNNNACFAVKIMFVVISRCTSCYLRITKIIFPGGFLFQQTSVSSWSVLIAATHLFDQVRQ